MSLLSPSSSSSAVDGGWLATITRTSSAGPYVTAPRLQRGYEYGPCQAPALAPGEPPYTTGDRVIVNAYEGRPDELIIVARTHAVADPTTPPPGPHQHDAADVTSGVFDPERIPDLEQLAGTITPEQLGDVPAANLTGTIAPERLPAPTAPAGEVLVWAGTAATKPAGTLVCDGALVSRAAYPALFAAIGVTYGAGNGTTTFALPNLLGRVVVGVNPSDPALDAPGETGGAKTHTLTVDEMPSHTHTQNPHTHTQDPHTHTQDSHNHSQNSHNHSQNSHGHTSPAHSHGSDSGTLGWASSQYAAGGNAGYVAGGSARSTTGTAVAINNTTATNNATAATNNPTTATNQDTTATNRNTTATNQNTGGGAAHNNMQPYLTLLYLIRT